ncbi:uncharacterized protein TNCV_3146961 [Trichonephila clavipes]|nr:uncharacterized protein TNCV_3146961 [Trichonephila clavipes]
MNVCLRAPAAAALTVSSFYCPSLSVPIILGYSEIVTYTAACILNEGFRPVLKVMEVMGVTIGQTARDYADTVDNAHILRTEKTAEANCKEARTLRMALKAAENDNLEETEGLLYAPGIVD